MELPGSGQYADRANKVPMDGGASSSAAFGGFIRKLITLAAGGAAAGAAGAAGGAAGGGGAAAGAAPGAGAGMFADVAAGASSTAPAAAAATPTMGASFMQGAAQGGLKGGLHGMFTNYAGQQPAGSMMNNFATGAARSGNMIGGLQAQFMDPMGAPVVGNYNMFDLTNMGLQRLMQGGQQQRKPSSWWRP